MTHWWPNKIEFGQNLCIGWIPGFLKFLEFNLSMKSFRKSNFQTHIKMQSPTEREKIFTQRVLSGGDIQRIDLTNVADQWNGDENFGLQIEIENGSSDHFRWVGHLWLILYESQSMTQGQWLIKVYLGWDVLLDQNWMTHQFYFLILMMVLQARNYLDLEGKISAITS